MQDVIFHRYNPRKCFFPLEISLQDMIFSEITDNPLKSQIIGPKIHQTVAQLTDSDLSLFTKAFCNNRGQNSLGERGRIHFYLPLPGVCHQTYSDIINKFSQMDTLPFSLEYGAPQSRARSMVKTFLQN